jgi:hypothetical protein
MRDMDEDGSGEVSFDGFAIRLAIWPPETALGPPIKKPDNYWYHVEDFSSTSSISWSLDGC